jgi:hypothetical protein
MFLLVNERNCGNVGTGALAMAFAIDSQLPGRGKVKKVKEYRQHAKECRELGHKAHGDLKSHYEEMARVWDKLAQERLDFFVVHPEQDTEGEVAEDVTR